MIPIEFDSQPREAGCDNCKDRPATETIRYRDGDWKLFTIELCLPCKEAWEWGCAVAQDGCIVDEDDEEEEEFYDDEEAE